MNSKPRRGIFLIGVRITKIKNVLLSLGDLEYSNIFECFHIDDVPDHREHTNNDIGKEKYKLPCYLIACTKKSVNDGTP